MLRRLVSKAINPLAVFLVDTGRTGYLANRLFAAAFVLEFWGGVADAGGPPSRT
jgi:hypothetical protein